MTADRKLLAATFAAIAFLTAGPARAALSPPSATAPAAGVTVVFLPSFAWTPVKNADHYEFQVSADPGMGSPVLGGGKDDFFTNNTRATLPETVPNGTYYWHVRAISADGSVSGWTPTRAFKKLWNLKPAIQTPAPGASLTFPSNPVVLRWSGIPGAAEYLVPVASDPLLGSIVFRYSNQDDLNGPPNVAATSAAIASPLAPGSYYWAVQPVDAEGNRGVQTPVTTFSWVWPSTTVPQVTDLDPSAEVFDPKFSWNPVPGAARYEVEINPSVDFAPGSKVCCTGTTIATPKRAAPPVANELSRLVTAAYCVRVRARTHRDTNSQDVYGDETYLDDGTGRGTAFDWTGYPTAAPSACLGYLCSGDYLTPAAHVTKTRTPYFTWNPIPGVQSYFVLVSKD